MSDIEGLLVSAAALKYMSEQVSKAEAAVRAELMAKMKPGDRRVAALSSGTEVGAVTIGRPSETAAVVDEDAFMRWVEENRPDEITGVVRPAYRASVLAECAKRGAPCTRDGEVVPGVQMRRGSPSFRPTYNEETIGTPEALDAIRANAILAIEGEFEL